MTRIQQVHWEFVMDYIGNPYFVTGNAILHALAQNLSHDIHRLLHASHGVFVPGEFGSFPSEHSQKGTQPQVGGTLTDVEFYDDLFLLRNPQQPWLLDSKPRDLFNTHDVRLQSGHPALAYRSVLGMPEDAYKSRHTTTWYLTAYLHADDDSVLPLADDDLDELQLGGQRNLGYSQTRLKDTQLVNLDALDYSRLRDADGHLLELMTPYVLESAYPGAEGQDIPWWWAEKRSELRERNSTIFEQREPYDVVTVDHGQVVEYTGNQPIQTAKNGIERVGTHSKYGFGELRVKPI